MMKLTLSFFWNFYVATYDTLGRLILILLNIKKSEQS